MEKQTGIVYHKASAYDYDIELMDLKSRCESNYDDDDDFNLNNDEKIGDEERRRQAVQMGENLYRCYRAHLRYARMCLLEHTIVLLIVAAVVWFWGDICDVDGPVKWITSIFSGLYFTQILWCNLKRTPITESWPLERRAKGRDWINGGFFTFLIIFVVGCFYVDGLKLIYIWYVASLSIGVLTTILWRLAKSFSDAFTDEGPLEYAVRLLEANNRRVARKHMWSNLRDIFFDWD